MMWDSGARGSTSHYRQIGALRGLMRTATGDLVAVPSSLRRGVKDRDQYFASTHGSRKGLVDTAINTQKSGSLTKQLTVVLERTSVRAADCGAGSLLACVGHVCAACYGEDPATGVRVAVGRPVGLIAAQALGERSTQLTLRTFQTAGADESDVIEGTRGLLRLLQRPPEEGPEAFVQACLAELEAGQIALDRRHLELLARVLYERGPRSVLAVAKDRSWVASCTVGWMRDRVRTALERGQVDPLTGPRERFITGRTDG
jgi:hypothetical protein